MKIKKHPIDSKLLEGPVIEIEDVSVSDDLSSLEEVWVKEYKPVYTVCKVPETQPQIIQKLEEIGFRFIETQVRVIVPLENRKTGTAYFPYRLEEVSEQDDLLAIKQMVADNFTDNRFAIDKNIPIGMAVERYQLFLEQSFDAPNEKLFKMYHTQSKEIVGFNSHLAESSREARILLGGLKKEYQQQLAGINFLLHFEQLEKQGFRLAYTYISGKSYREMNYDINVPGSHIVECRIVLRKRYS